MNQLQLKTRWRLQQYGFSVGRISELLESYKSSGFTHDDEQFVRYCLTNRESSSVLTKPRQLSWSPSSLVNSTLTQAGIPSSFIQSSLTDYLGTAKQAPSNVAFLDFCSRAYTKSSLNRLSKEPTYMVRGWLPDENVRKTLIDEGANDKWLDAAVGEFELYWREQNVPKPNWSRKFLWWARRQFAKGQYSWLL